MTLRDDVYPRGVSGTLSRASVSHYNAWLKRYLDAGGVVTHAYDYPFPSEGWYRGAGVIRFEEPLYGADHINVLALPGCTIEGDPGHCRIFWMSGSPRMTPLESWVPVYTDTI
jgi:hypothetical protein